MCAEALGTQVLAWGGQGGEGPTFRVQFSQWPHEAFLLVSHGCCPGPVLLLLQQVLLCPALGVVLPQGWDLWETSHPVPKQ